MPRAAAQLSASDIDRSLRFLRARRAEAPSIEAFARSANAGLAELIGADLVTLSYCDLRAGTRSVVVWPDRALGADEIACFNRHFQTHPLVRYHASHPHGGAHRISDCLTSTQFRHSALYAEYYRRIGIASVVAVPVHIDAERVISFVLNRGNRDFSLRDCQLLDAVRLQLGAEYAAQEARLRARRTLAQLNEVLLGAGVAVVVLDAGRQVTQLSEQALRWLACAGLGREVRVGQRLPETIDRWMRTRVEPSWASFDPGPLKLAAPGHTLRLHLLQADDGLTLMIECAAPEGRSEVGRDSGLTAREREIVRWLAAGKSNAHIGVILGISARTVHKHLERVYRKLGVENRTAAVMRALQLLQEP